MTAVFVDTNILLSDPTLRGAHITKLMIGCKRCGIAIFVPEIVRDELDGHRQQQVAQHLRKIEGDIRALARFGLPYAQSTIDLLKDAAAFRAQVAAVLAKFDVKGIDYPDVSPKELIRASYENRKPFKSNGEGYKDYLVFKSLLVLLAEEDDVHFLTNNHKDFCGDDGDLHHELRAALSNGASVTVHASAQEFYDNVLAPRLEELGPLDNPEVIIEAIQQGRFPGFDLHTRLELVLIDELVEGRPDLDAVSTPLDDVTVNQVMGFTVDDVRVSALDKDTLSIDIGGEVQLELFGFMQKWEYFGSSEELDVHLDNGDWNDHVVSGYTTTSNTFELSIVFDQANHEVRSVNVDITS